MNRDPGLRQDLSTAEFELFRDWIHQHSGIFLEDEKIDPLRISLLARATRLGFLDYRDYFRQLSEDEAEFNELLNLITINETSFFRFPAQFDALRDAIVPELIAARPPEALRRFRVWSAGCSTGEEPYTIGMSLLDSSLPAHHYSIEVVGSDVSTQALERAREGVYSAKSLASLPQGVVQRWFEPVSHGHRPVKAVRDLVHFHYQNLIKEPYPSAYLSGWDVIFCRNVTIYFKLESTRRVVDSFYEALNPGGYLFIGHSETLTSVDERFEPVEVGGVFVYRKPARTWVATTPVRHRPAGPGGWHERARLRAQERAAEESAKATTLVAVEPVQTRTVEVVAAPESAEAASPPAVHASTPDLAQAHELLEQADPARALRIAEQILEAEPANREARLLAAFAHADLDDLETATAHVKLILEAEPLAASAHYILGVIRRRSGELDRARGEFRAALYSDEDFVLAYFALASLYRESGQVDEARRAYENVLRALSANPEGEWTLFLGGFKPDLIAQSCERGLIECARTDPGS